MIAGDLESFLDRRKPIFRDRIIRRERANGLPGLPIGGPHKLAALHRPAMRGVEKMQTSHLRIVGVGVAYLRAQCWPPSVVWKMEPPEPLPAIHPTLSFAK